MKAHHRNIARDLQSSFMQHSHRTCCSHQCRAKNSRRPLRQKVPHRVSTSFRRIARNSDQFGIKGYPVTFEAVAIACKTLACVEATRPTRQMRDTPMPHLRQMIDRDRRGRAAVQHNAVRASLQLPVQQHEWRVCGLKLFTQQAIIIKTRYQQSISTVTMPKWLSATASAMKNTLAATSQAVACM